LEVGYEVEIQLALGSRRRNRIKVALPMSQRLPRRLQWPETEARIGFGHRCGAPHGDAVDRRRMDDEHTRLEELAPTRSFATALDDFIRRYGDVTIYGPTARAKREELAKQVPEVRACASGIGAYSGHAGATGRGVSTNGCCILTASDEGTAQTSRSGGGTLADHGGCGHWRMIRLVVISSSR
jgi:hypothetical protein